MEKNQKRAIILGATGLVGGKLLRFLLEDDRYKMITVLSRRKLDISHPKLNVVVGDLLQLKAFGKEVQGDEVFCCIGTTKAKTPEKERYKAIDYGIPVNMAKHCKENDITTFITISAMGADPKSPIFYNRIKGEMEQDVIAIGLPKTHIVQPGLIGGKREEKRPGEYFFKKVLGGLDFLMIGPLQQYWIILPETIARAMLWLANHPYDPIRVSSTILKTIGTNGTSGN